MSRFPTHVMVYDEQSQVHEPMTLENFAALFTYGQTISMGPNGPESMTHDIRVKSRAGMPSESESR